MTDPENLALARRALIEAETAVVDGVDRLDIGSVVAGFGSWLATAVMWPNAVDGEQAARTCKVVGHGLAMCRMPEARRAVYQLGSDYGPPDSFETLYCLGNSAAQYIDQGLHNQALVVLTDLTEHPLFERMPLKAQCQIRANVAEALGGLGKVEEIRQIAESLPDIPDPEARMTLEVGVLLGLVHAKEWTEAAASAASSMDLDDAAALGPEMLLLLSALRAETAAAGGKWDEVASICKAALGRWDGADANWSLRLLRLLGEAHEAVGDYQALAVTLRRSAEVVQQAEAYRSDVFDALLAAMMRAHSVAAGAQAAEKEGDAGLLNEVAHELRTPLTSLSGFTDILLEDPDVPNDQRELLTLMQSEIATSVDLVDDLLTVGHARTARLVLTSAPTDAATEIAQLTQRLAPQMPHVTLTGSGWVVADPHRFRQIVRNLLTNAKRYGGEECGVTITAAGSHTLIDVWDTGHPIPMDVRATLFSPYIGSPRADSVGLGLNVARTLTQAMGGNITYRHDGDRAHFEVRLPAPSQQRAGPTTRPAPHD